MEALSYIQETESLVQRAPTKEGKFFVRAAYNALQNAHVAHGTQAKAKQLMIARVACGQARNTVPVLPDA